MVPISGVSGTSRPAGRDLTAEMYYEDEGRSYDKVIRRDLTVMDEEIEELLPSDERSSCR